MNKKLKQSLTILISALLAIGLIGFSLSGINFEHTVQSLQQANYIWVIVSFLLGIFAYWVRSERWKLLLEPMGYNISSKDSFISVCMNYFWNLLIPRSGELARCTSLYTLEKVPVNKSFGTVITERIIDFLCLMIIALIAFISNFNLIKELIIEVIKLRETETSEPNYSFIYVIIGFFILSCTLFFIFSKRLKKFSIWGKIKNFIYGLKQGLKTIFFLKKKRLFIFYTFVIWLSYYLMTYLVVFALPETSHLGWTDGFYLLLVGGIGMVIPASGGIGAYHAAMRLGFVVLGFNKEVGLTFAFLVHTPHSLISLLLGIICLIMIYFKKKTALASSL